MAKGIRITLEGRIPSKKNSRQQVWAGKRMINVPSKKYKEWHREAEFQIIKQELNHIKPYGVEIDFWMPDNRKADLTNKAESIMDLLVDCGVIEDDKWQIISHIILHCNGIDRENPRAEIWIKERAN